ncbi:fatty acid desaturase [Pseudonocardia saturnea]|uniref:Fatty acid desaturase n=1 Tax=Pseudonocardia saturnea TaxID=33909 RepID=A0ABQ0S9B4_9PSEU|nr:fatty acid desaturase [Pseudonocardia autotrophica]GEC29510.1 fatty acid desaturase [Pseudonocardia saturnea]
MDTGRSPGTGAEPPIPEDRPAQQRHVNGYVALVHAVDEHGLLRRRHGYYGIRAAATIAAFVAVMASVVLIGDSWWQLVPAAVLGVVSTQFGFLGHDLAHRQVFNSARANVWSARVVAGLFTGLSYTWWMGKHNAHHRSPNQEERDPDIGPGVLAFTPAAAAPRTGLAAWLTRRQGWAFFPLLTLEGVALHVVSVQTLLRDRTRTHRWLELTFIAIRLGGYAALLLSLLPVGKAAAAAGLHLAVFGVLLGGSFAPNHKGMPIVPATMEVDFLHRQVVMSRNISGGRLVEFMMGGLNRQIEHHLFPSMPRPNLARAAPLVRAYCAEHGIPYTETSLIRSYGIVVRYLNAVGLAERDPFQCPLVRRYRA